VRRLDARLRTTFVQPCASAFSSFPNRGIYKVSEGQGPCQLYLLFENRTISVTDILIEYYIYKYPIVVIISLVFMRGFWDLAKYTCGAGGVPFLGWYLSACAIFDVVCTQQKLAFQCIVRV
jgi:hypothetical protein